MRTLSAAAVVIVLFASAPASAQSAPSSDEDAVMLGILTGVTTFSAVWVTTIPWRGFWHDSPTPSDWRSWVSALLVGAAAGVSTALLRPRNYDAVFDQALVLSASTATMIPILLARAVLDLTNSCNEYCHKVMIALPLFLGLTASFIVGQVMDADLGEPAMVAPLVIEL